MRCIRFLSIAVISFLTITGSEILAADSTTIIAQRGSDNPETPSLPLPDSGFPSNSGSFEDLFRTPGEQNERAAFERDFRRADVNRAVELFEEYQVKQFKKHLGLTSSVRTPTVAEISQRLSNLSQATGKKPALSYVVSLKDELHLILILPNSQSTALAQKPATSLLAKTLSKILGQQQTTSPASRVILKVTRPALKKVADEFRSQVISKRFVTPTGYKASARTLYQEFIAPLEPQLKANKIDTLVVAADSGLRSLPIAALYDGKQFLIEKYSFALIPTFGLTSPSSLVNLQNAQLLAMGISQSTENQPPLPAVNVEISTLSRELWQGNTSTLLNSESTLDNLKSVSSRQRFGIVHLATHADFKPGKLSESYIQLWNAKLRLNQLRDLFAPLVSNTVDMLVLSACKTAVGDEQAELGFAGLAVQGKVKTAVGSLWYVSDEGTLALMSEFYSRLKTAPTKADALRQAQLAMLKGQVQEAGGNLQLSNQKRIPLPAEIANTGNDLSHPFFWSGFTVVGNWN